MCWRTRCRSFPTSCPRPHSPFEFECCYFASSCYLILSSLSSRTPILYCTVQQWRVFPSLPLSLPYHTAPTCQSTGDVSVPASLFLWLCQCWLGVSVCVCALGWINPPQRSSFLSPCLPGLQYLSTYVNLKSCLRLWCAERGKISQNTVAGTKLSILNTRI